MLKKILMMICLLPTMVFAAETFEAGKDYTVLPVQNVTQEPGKTKVLEFFSYGCPSCYNIENAVSNWVKEKGNTIDFEKVPVVFHKNWENYAKAYYVAKSLSELDKLNPLLFKAVQVDKETLTTNQSMIDFFIKNGVDKDLATSAFEHSLTVDMLVKEGMNKMGQYQILVIPTFVINDTYKTDLQMAQNPERLVAILNYLVSKDKKS